MKCARLPRLALLVAALLAPLAPATASLIGNSSTGGIFQVNTTTGAASLISTTTTSSLVGVAFQPGTGDLFGLTTFAGTPTNSLVKIDPLTGATTTVGATGLANIFEGDLAFNPLNGLLYGIQNAPTGARQLFAINSLTGSATILGSIASNGDYSAIAFNSAGALLTIESAGTTNSILNTLNPTNGAILTSVTMNVDLGSTVGMAFDPLTGLAYVADGQTAGTNRLYTLNTTTGVLTTVGALGITNGLAGLAFTPVPPAVPEPGTAIAGLGHGRPRRSAPSAVMVRDSVPPRNPARRFLCVKVTIAP